MQQSTSAILILNRFVRLSVNENLLLLSFVSHFVHFVLCI